MITNYFKKCGYNLGGLKPFIYLIERNDKNISVDILNLSFKIGEANVKKLNVSSSQIQHHQSNFNKFQFDSTLTLSMYETYLDSNLELLNDLIKSNYYVIVENKEGRQFLINYDFKSKITYEYIFDNDENSVEITFSNSSNLPLLESSEKISTSIELNHSQNDLYQIGGIKKLKIALRDKVRMNCNGFEVVEFDYEIEDMHEVEFDDASATINFNGDYFEQNINFQIGIDNVFGYTLIEHPYNDYIALFQSNNGKFYVIGENGLQAKYDVIFDGENSEYIDINLSGYSNKSILSSVTAYKTRWGYYNEICDGYDLYEYESLQYTEDGEKWENVYPLQTRKGDLIEANSLECISSDDDEPSIIATYKGNGNNSTKIYKVSPNYSYVTIDGIQYNNIDETIMFGDTNEHIVEFYGVDEISDYAFYECGLIKVEFSSKIKKIGEKSFEYCYNLSHIIIPKEANCEIGDEAFGYCSNLTEANLEGVTSINIHSFVWCNRLINVTFSDKIQVIGYHSFGECKYLSSITIPYNANCKIGDGAFTNCEKLTEANLYGVTDTGIASFQALKYLTSVTFSDKIQVIMQDSFSYCNHLSSITFNSETPPTLGRYVFSGLPQDGTIYVSSQYYGSTWGTWVTNNFPSGWQLRALD